MTEAITGERIARLPMRDNEAGAETIGEYLLALAQTCWREGEGFNGKRPFGDSCWEGDLYRPLAEAGLINGEYEEYESGSEDYAPWKDWHDFDEKSGNALIDKAFEYLFAQVQPTVL